MPILTDALNGSCTNMNNRNSHIVRNSASRLRSAKTGRKLTPFSSSQDSHESITTEKDPATERRLS